MKNIGKKSNYARNNVKKEIETFFIVVFVIITSHNVKLNYNNNKIIVIDNVQSVIENTYKQQQQ